jgi:hypothetical protein
MSILSKVRSLLIIYAALVGCTATPTHQSPVIFTEQTSQHDEFDQFSNLNELMQYHDLLQEKNTFQLSWEHNYAKNHFKNSPNPENRLKYILLISLPNTAFTDSHAALDLLNNWPEEIILPPNLASFQKIIDDTALRTANCKKQCKKFNTKIKSIRRASSNPTK